MSAWNKSLFQNVRNHGWRSCYFCSGQRHKKADCAGYRIFLFYARQDVRQDRLNSLIKPLDIIAEALYHQDREPPHTVRHGLQQVSRYSDQYITECDRFVYYEAAMVLLSINEQGDQFLR